MDNETFGVKNVLIAILAVALVAVGWTAISAKKNQSSPEKNLQSPEQQSASAPAADKVDCTVTEGKRVTRGDSMNGVVNDGREVTVLQNYYACKNAERGDVVVYNYAGTTPILKMIKGKPGDKLELVKGGSGWNILINGEVIKNSEGKPYLVDSHGYNMLSLYIKDYRGFIPFDSYLILGNDPNGSLDSTRFGLVARQDLLGKISN